MKRTCAAPVMDAKGRAFICGKPATTKRMVEGIELDFCAACAANLDAKILPSVTVTRFDPEIAVRLDAMAVALAPSGHAPSRADAIRTAVLLGLEAWEAGAKKKGGRR